MKRRAFTLIELLVVIGVIAILMSILVPALSKARQAAKKTVCKTNLHAVGVAIGGYRAEYQFDFERKTRWYYKNGTADHAHEWQPQAVEDLIAGRMLPDRKAFFCPSVQNLSWKANYSTLDVYSSDFTTKETDIITARPNDYPVFWGTMHWLWKKRVTVETPQVNPVSDDAVMCDMSPSAWIRTFEQLPTQPIRMLREGGVRVNHPYNYEHYNVLMKDLSVQNPADKDERVNMWLWGQPNWPGS